MQQKTQKDFARQFFLLYFFKLQEDHQLWQVELRHGLSRLRRVPERAALAFAKAVCAIDKRAVAKSLAIATHCANPSATLIRQIYTVAFAAGTFLSRPETGRGQKSIVIPRSTFDF